MEFINTTRNAVKLQDIEKTIPFLGDNIPQMISSDEINRSKSFQYMCLSKKFLIVSVDNSRIEQNLWNLQQKVSMEIPPPIEVSMEGQFLNNSGYGKANRNLTYALATAGIKIGVIIDNSDDDLMPQGEIESISRFIRHEMADIHISSYVPSFAKRDPSCKYAILNTTVEAASVPIDFVTTCDEFDEVWVVSDFCKNVLTEYGVSKPITVIPNAINTSLYNTNVKPHYFDPPLKSFVFVCVASWNFRKGQDVLLKAYVNEFSSSDDITLLFVNTYGENGKNDKTTQDIKKAILNKPDFPHIARSGRSIPEYDMPRIYRGCGAFVLPSRGEGFCTPYLEAGSCRLPVISTRHGGQLMFLNDENSYLVDIDGLKECEMGKTDIHYWDGHLFASIESNEFIHRLQKTMRHVFENREEARAKAVKLAETAKNYSLQSVGLIASERLRNIWKNFSS